MALELGIRDTLLPPQETGNPNSGWVAFGGAGALGDGELARLKRELAKIRKERDFLREAATFFAQRSS